MVKQISEIIGKHTLFKQSSKKELKFAGKPCITPALKVSIMAKSVINSFP